MNRVTLKRWMINQFIRFRVFQNRFTMLIFIKKNWFVIGLAIIGLAFLNKKMPGILPWNSAPKQEKFTAAAPEEGQSLFGMPAGVATALPSSALPDIPQETAKTFLKRFAKVVQGEQEKYHIPASALLALAYVNSHSGTRGLAAEANNYFAMPCGPSWDGASAEVAGHCFRSYDNAWNSFRDASEQMSATRWAQKLIQKKVTDPEAWMEAFVENGYSDVKEAAPAMKGVFKAYRLFELDK